jgi:hypothetical protein
MVVWHWGWKPLSLCHTTPNSISMRSIHRAVSATTPTATNYRHIFSFRTTSQWPATAITATAVAVAATRVEAATPAPPPAPL